MATGRTRRLLYRSFRLVYVVEQWMARRFTPAGRLALGGLGAAAVVGLDTNRTVAYQAFAFLAVLLTLSLGAALLFRARFTVERLLPRYGTVGEPLPYRLAVESGSARQQSDLLVVEELADPRPSLADLMTGREPGEERRNWFDRTVAYPRWVWLIGQNRQATPEERAVPSLPARGRTELSMAIVPARRGHLTFVATTIARPDPFGLFKACVRVPASGSVLVLPRRYPVPRVTLPGRRRYQRGGVSLTTSVGDSEEFVALRDYRPGDALRRVHWKSWARLGKPIVKEYQDEFFVRHALVLDTFAATPPVDAARFEEAVSVAASYACAVASQESLLDLLFVGPEAYAFTMGRGLAQTERLLEILAGVRACTTHPFDALARLALDGHAALSGAICVLLAWDEPRQALIAALEARGVPTLVLVVAEPPAADGREADVAPSGGLHFLPPGRVAEGLARL